MIISVAELRQFVTTGETDQQLQFRIEAVESFICAYTNNQFMSRTTHEKSYPKDVQMGAINLIGWDVNNRDKLGIASETISRHSVSYSGMTGADSTGGYPTALTGFLRPYTKARF